MSTRSPARAKCGSGWGRSKASGRSHPVSSPSAPEADRSPRWPTSPPVWSCPPPPAG